MSTYTIELSEYEGMSGSSNGEWYNQFNNKLVIENGDIIQIKQALINTQSSSVENINISEDTVITISFGLYDNPISGSNAQVIMLPSNMQQGINNPYTYRSEFYDPGTPDYIESKALALPANNSSYDTPWVAMTKTPSGILIRAIIEINITIKKGVYEPDQLGDLISKGMQSQYTTSYNFPMTDGSSLPLFFCLQSYYPVLRDKNTVTIEDNQYIYFLKYNDDANNFRQYLVGAPSPAFQYVNGKFEFTYLHTPVLLNPNGSSGSSPYTEIGVSKYDHGGISYYYSKYSGLYLENLSVQSGVSNFWDILGFTQTSFIDNDCSNIFDNTTTAYLPLGAIENKAYSLPIYNFSLTGGWDYFINSDVSTSVEAEIPYQYDDTGYYLINVISSFNNNYINQNETLSKVCCVCSKQYQAGDYITAYSESSIPYQHSGEPLLLSNFQIQIIEPKSKLIANNLGANSTIFLELIKAQQPTVQPSKTDDKK